MRDLNRIDDFLKVFGDAWKTVPDWRFFQLICNLQKAKQSDCFYIEDEDIKQFIIELFKLESNNKEN